MEKITKTPVCIAKWQNSIDLENINWKHTFLNPFKVCRETELQSFQYKILHWIITCNDWLNTMNIKESPNCIFCKTDDNIIHYFSLCKRVKQLWISSETWWIRTSGDIGQLNISTIIFGAQSSSNHANLFNYCLILAKMYIYILKMKNETTVIDFHRFLVFLKEKLVLEKLNAKLKDRQDNFKETFGLVYNNL